MLFLRSVKDQVQRVGKCATSLPEPQSMNDEREKLEEQLANLCRDIGDILDQNTVINKLVSKGLFGMRVVCCNVSVIEIATLRPEANRPMNVK